MSPSDRHADEGKQVTMSYRQAAKGYGIGFACAFFMAATVVAYPIMWKQHVPETLYATAVLALVLLSTLGFILIGLAYTVPERLYEVLENGT